MEAKPVMISDLGTIQQAGLQKKRSGGQASFLAMIEEAAGSVTDSREAKRYEKPERLYQGSETVGKRNKKSSRNHSLSSIDEGDTGEAGSLDLAGNEARSDRIANRSTANQSEKPVRLTEGPITGSKSAAERKPSPDVKSTHSEHLMKTADGQDQAAAIESVLKSSDVQEGQASKSIKSIQQPAADHHEASNLGEKSQSKQLDGSSPAGTASNKYSSANRRSQLMDGTDMKAYFEKSRFPKTGEAGSGPDELSVAEQSIGGQPMDTLRRRIGARTALSNGANASSVQAEQLQQLAASGKTASNTDGLERIAPFSPDSLAPRSLAERDASGSQIQADTSIAVKRNNDKQPMDMGRHGARRNREQTALGDGANVSSAQAERQNKTLKRPTVQTAEDDQTAGEWRANKPPLLDESNTGAVLSKHQTIHDVFTKEAIKPAVHLSAHDQSQLKDNETLKSQNNSPNGTNRQSRNARLTAGLRSETMPAKTAFAETSARLTAAAASASGSKVLQPYVQPQERALQAEQSGEMRLQRVERAAGKVTGGIQVKGEKDSENDIKAALQDVQNGSTHFPGTGKNGCERIIIFCF
ncbi:hypothetical protein QS257_13485 [Terrilactibacillus sp. S3-3]|nr:hypothetical protein QS257_13485 [Terrilactibacillus sp. S3-3]